MKDRINFPNPPVQQWYPGADKDQKVLRNYQMYALAWMESWIDYGGGILGDEIGLGKVFMRVEHDNATFKNDLTSRLAKY
jgi:SNF2 family DNA or RNA helicase